MILIVKGLTKLISNSFINFQSMVGLLTIGIRVLLKKKTIGIRPITTSRVRVMEEVTYRLD